MAGEADYEIVSRIVVEDSTTGGLNTGKKRLQDFEKEGKRVSSNLQTWFSRAFALLGGGAVISRAARGIIGLNDEVRTANAGMATLIGGIANMPISDAMGVARQQVAGLREDAAKGVGELDNYIRGFQMLLGPGLSGGASFQQLRDLTRNSLAAGFAMRGGAGLEQAPMDIVQALTSGVNDRQTPIAMAALTALSLNKELTKTLGKTEQAALKAFSRGNASPFNALKTAKQIDVLNLAFGTFSEGVELMGQSWEAQMGTFRDGVREVLRTVTEPIYDRWLLGLNKANDWLAKNQDRLQVIAQIAGEKLASAWDHIVRQAGTYLALVAAASTYQAVGGRAGLAGAGQGLAGAVGSGRGLAGRFSTGLGLGGDIFGALRGLAGTAGRLAGPLALVTALFLGIKGAIGEYPQIFTMLGAAGAQFLAVAAEVGNAFGVLTGEGSALNLVGAALGVALTGVVKVGSVLLGVIGALVTGFGFMVRALGGLLKAMVLASTHDFVGAKDALGGIGDASIQSKKQLKALFDVAAKGLAFEAPTTPELPDVDGAKKGGTVVNNNFSGPMKIEITAESMEDPARVAVAVETVLERLQKYPTQGPRPRLASRR